MGLARVQEMTVGELTAELSRFNEKLPVLVEDMASKDGCCRIDRVEYVPQMNCVMIYVEEE